MKQHPTQEKWMEYLYEEMDSAGRNALETHLKACAACRQKQVELGGAMNALDEWRVQIPEKVSLKAGTNRFQPLVKWAAAAALLVTTGFATARFSQPQVDLAALKSQISSEVQRPLEQKMEERIEAAAEQAVANAREKLDMEVAARIQEIALRARSDALMAMQQQLEELQLDLAVAREEDRKALNAALKKVENQWLTQLRTIREDLERVAVFSDESYRSAQRQLVQLASYAQPIVNTSEQEH